MPRFVPIGIALPLLGHPQGQDETVSGYTFK